MPELKITLKFLSQVELLHYSETWGIWSIEYIRSKNAFSYSKDLLAK